MLAYVVAGASVAGCGRAAQGHVLPPATIADDVLGGGIDRASLVIEPDDGVRPVVRQINQAQSTIFICGYILTDKSVLRALERAATQGVDTYVMLEPQPFGGLRPGPVASALRAAGVQVRWTRPGFTYTHAKYMVVDDRTAIVSSANFSRAAFTSNRDILVIDRSPADVHEVSSLFRWDWDRLTATIRDANLVVAPANAREKLLHLIKSARKTIDIYAEEMSDVQVERGLARAVHRGVIVRLLLASSTPSRVVSELRLRGLHVRTPRRPYVHAKFLAVDDREAYVGSENFSAVSLDQNRELGILIRGTALRRILGIFRADWTGCALSGGGIRPRREPRCF